MSMPTVVAAASDDVQERVGQRPVDRRDVRAVRLNVSRDPLPPTSIDSRLRATQPLDYP